MDREEDMIKLEIMNCKQNIKFYELQIENMEEKLEELKKMYNKNNYY